MILQIPFPLFEVGEDANPSDLPLLASSPTAMMVKTNSIFQPLLKTYLRL
jgi:hypothetical protein